MLPRSRKNPSGVAETWIDPCKFDLLTFPIQKPGLHCLKKSKKRRKNLFCRDEMCLKLYRPVPANTLFWPVGGNFKGYGNIGGAD